jgi:chromosomal replication initiator protein
LQNVCAPGEEPLTISDREVVAALEQAIARRIGEPRYNLWFNQNTKFTWADDRLLVGVPNHFFQDWLQNTFVDAVRAAAADVLGRPMQVRFAIDPELFQTVRRAQVQSAERGVAQPGESSEPTESMARPAHPGAGGKSPQAPARRQPKSATAKRTRQWKRLSDFVVGPCNRVAHASALSVVEAPGQNGNPLVLHGSVGTGKSHLLEGIYAGLRKNYADWRVCFVTAEEFTNRFVQAMRLGKLSSFRHYFRASDALLIDDLHFLARKRATQEEFLHTFDALQAAGRFLAVTCDCHPKLADELTPELTDRLLGGAIWGLAPPDSDTRLDILRAKTVRGESPLPEDVLVFLANQLRGNVRELEGALHSVRHYGRVTGRPADLPLAREALGDLVRHSIRPVQLAEVDCALCKALRLERGALQSRQRNWAVSHPRMLAMFLARKHTGAAYSEIGQYFGGRNHSTAVAAEKKVRHWLRDDGQLSLGGRQLRVREMISLAERELLR